MIFRGAVAAVVGKPALDALTKQASPLDRSRWNAVTIELSTRRLHVAEATLFRWSICRDVVVIRMVPAPGSWGTELGARPKPGVSGISAGDLRQDVRRALRQSKTLLEAAEILRNEPVPHGKDRPNPPDGSWMNGRSVFREEDSCESSDAIDRYQYRLDQVETHIGADTRLHVDLCAGRAKGNDGRTLAGRMH
jgi:hypothetical protein